MSKLQTPPIDQVKPPIAKSITIIGQDTDKSQVLGQ